MVEYAYRDLFYKSQQTKDILIVDSEAVVTINPGGDPIVENTTVEIHTADLKINTFTLDESLCSEDDLKWGLMESAEVRFTIKNTRRIPNLKNTDYSKMVNIYIYFNGDSSTLFQIGQYICDSDKYSADRRFRDIVLYDALYYLRNWDITEWYNEVYADNDNDPISVYDLRFSLFDYMFTDFDYPIEQNEETELVNDDCLVPKNIESDTITFDFFMGGILNANGVFGHMGRTGLFEYVTLVKYDAPTVTTVTDDFRKPPTTYEDFAVWGIGYVAVYDQNNIRLAYEGSSSYKRPSIYNIVDNFVLNGIYSNSGADELKTAVANIREQVTHRRYAPMDVEHVGDLCVEVGDNVAVTGDIGNYNTYVLERHLKGLGTMLDKYISRGNRKQPKYKINDNWHIGDSQNNSTEGYGGVSEVPSDDKTKFIKYCKNIGIQFLYEPTVNIEYVRNSESHQVEIKWTDPPDLTTYRPHPVEWAGTIVVRSEKDIPEHPWDDCEILVDSTTRDEYSVTAYVDDTIEENKKYYYGIFPYYIMLDDAEHPKKCYRFTKVYSVNTQRLSLAPLIVSHSVSGTNVTLTFEVPTLDSGSYSYIKVVAKKDQIPTSSSDGIVKSVNPTDTSVEFSDLDGLSRYYFVIFANDGISEIASDPDDCETGEAIIETITAEMLASNQLRINGNGEAPTITSGSMGTYDSATNSYYFANNCRMDWKNWSNIGMTLEKAQKLTKIEFEYEGMVSNNALGRGFDMQMQTYFNTNLLFINGIADGYDDGSSDKQRFARIKNSGSDQWETTEEVPFNNSSYQNAFHKVKWVWQIENSVAKGITIYVDDVVYCQHLNINYAFSITALGNQILRCDVIDHTNLRRIQIKFYYLE